MGEHLWYPVTDLHPGPLVRVRASVVIPGGRQGSYAVELDQASRGKPPYDDQWCEWKKEKAVPLPPGAVVMYWQPVRPDKWIAPLPPPVTGCQPRMWSEQQSFDAVEAAREMEHDREDARHGASDIYPHGHKQPLAWWRDATQIRYERAGSVTRKMAEGRVMRAVAFLGLGIRPTTSSPAGFSQALAELITINGQHCAMSDYIPRLRMLPQDDQDFLTASGWFVEISRLDGQGLDRCQRVLAYRSFDMPLSYAEIGREMEISGERARQVYEAAIERIWRVANGESAYVGARGRAGRIADLQHRNREAKRVARLIDG